jgi:hypothetical protein
MPNGPGMFQPGAHPAMRQQAMHFQASNQMSFSQQQQFYGQQPGVGNPPNPGMMGAHVLPNMSELWEQQSMTAGAAGIAPAAIWGSGGLSSAPHSAAAGMPMGPGMTGEEMQQPINGGMDDGQGGNAMLADGNVWSSNPGAQSEGAWTSSI